MRSDLVGDEIRQFYAEVDERRKLVRAALDPFAGIHTAALALDHSASIRSAMGTMDPFSTIRSALGAPDLISKDIARLAQIAQEGDSNWRRRLADSVRDALEGHAVAARATDSLLKLRVQTICESELAKAASALPQMNFATRIADSYAAQAKRIADATHPSRLTDTIAEQVQCSFQEETRQRMAELARPFASIANEVRKDMESAAGILDAGAWARRLGMPMIDAASIATVAREWGPDGALRHLREIGALDTDAWRLVAQAMEAEEDEREDSAADAQPSGVKRRDVNVDTLLAIFSILLTLLIWQSQNEDQELMEARLRADNSEISVEAREIERRTAERIDKLSRALELSLAHAKPGCEVQFVARSRGAAITREKGGGAKVAEALPGQVVALIAEEGKWIEISYFDFRSGHQHAGWALKKYFVRAKSAQFCEIEKNPS